MKIQNDIKPDFLIIGAQKSGTTWLWSMLNEHPETELPIEKEIHYFGGIENYRKGKEWYYNHFKNLAAGKLTGEASTTYLYDFMPYWHNSSKQLEFDGTLPSIPELIARELPDIKILVVLRDPVWRAVSAYKHWMRNGERIVPSPILGVKSVALANPKYRIIEYGFYAKYLKLWKKFVPAERMKILVFEEDIIKYPYRTLESVYKFLGLSSNYVPNNVERAIHVSSGLTQLVLNYYASRLSGYLLIKYFTRVLGKSKLLEKIIIRKSDLTFLRSIYVPEKSDVARLIDRDLNCWNYGAR